MSRKPSFANLRTTAPVTPAIEPTAAKRAAARPATDTPPPVAPDGTGEGGQTTAPAVKPVSREGRKQIAGFFTPDMSFAMHTLARRNGRSLQSLMAEAFNDVLRKYGESPVGE